MSLRKRTILMTLAALLACAGAFAQGEAPTARALILSTQTISPGGNYAKNAADWQRRFVTLLTKTCGVPEANVRVLSASADAKAKPAVRESTLANVQAAFETFKKELRPDDQFILVILGHGTVTEPVGKLCLVGEDLKATTLADLLDALPTRKIVVLNFASGGAAFLEKYARPGRVIVSASGKTGEGTQPYFAEFFLLAYERKEADANGDGTVTLLEAFNRSAHGCINWYHRQYKISKPKDEPALPRKVEVRTEEARRLFRKFYGGNTEIEMSAPETDEDESVEPKFDEIADLQLRREAPEHASLEDRGETTGTLHWANGKHEVLTGKSREEAGALAARTVLGSPALTEPPR